MSTESDSTPEAPVWFVGAAFGGATRDQTPRFLSGGIWEHNYKDKYLDLVRSMQPRERIAIKSSYRRKNSLPFDNRGIDVSVMAIKAVGTITENLNDGKRIRVYWTRVDPVREWYFFTSQRTVWKVFSSTPTKKGLISFTFENLPQDLSTFGGPDATYSIDDILADGCFLDRSEIGDALERLRTKKNLILQGPPGTGKTWLAKRLAFALVGRRDMQNVRVVQFHPNLTYEDFVRGWRPTGSGTLSLVDGVFLETMKAASADPSSVFVVVIEEINRGNPTQIFGELLTLLEADKRTPTEALELCYPDEDGKRRPVHIPENLYVIGTMNIADRSLALVDLALRRRFAFVGLEPRLGQRWQDWVIKKCGVDKVLLEKIEQRISALNKHIAEDSRLGKQFRIGHSYLTPAHQLDKGETIKWFRDVVETEIRPLLDEYWFDAPEEAKKAISPLLTDWP
jgi:5-methylcytosine-specific restriction protein B